MGSSAARGSDNTTVFTGLIWTIHFGFDNNNWSNERRLASLIREVNPDVFGLLETDIDRHFLNNRDLPYAIAQELDMYHVYGLPTREHNWGCAFFSKFPIVWSKSYTLPSPDGENACAIHATVSMYGTEVDVVVSHFGTEEYPHDRDLQSHKLAEIFRSTPRPTVFLGYILTKTFGENYEKIVKGGGMKDIDPTDRTRWCQYILYKQVQRLAYARITYGDLTDTEIQTARFRLFHNDTSSQHVFQDAPSILPRTQEPASLRYPDKFLGEGTGLHAYEYFPPKYFGVVKPINEQ